MWKWTNPKNIKVIILDADSLPNEFLEFQYYQYNPEVKVYKIKDFFNRNSSEEGFTYFDISTALEYILNQTQCESTSIISISKDPIFLKEMMQYHIGTVLVGNLKMEFLKNVPDFTDCTLESLPMILQKKKKGYGAEVYATFNETRKIMSLLKCNAEVNLDDGIAKSVDLYFGGRYYSDKHNYLLNDPLSYLTLKFKHQYIKIIDTFFDVASLFVMKNEEINIITYIPLKPKDIRNNRYDRFANLNLEKCAKYGIHVQSTLICNKDFSQKGNDLYMRKEMVKDAFEIRTDVKGKNIIILDDVFSSGSTLLEAIKVLYENGANKVIAIVLAVNQMTESSVKYKKLACTHCGSPMSLRINKKNGKAFFSCEGYDFHPSVHTSLNVEEGLDKLKDLNKLEMINVIDLEDKY